MKILGIETSCDDTSICILEDKKDGELPKIVIHESFSQELILKKWGGVVPEIAARNHLEKLGPLLQNVFVKSETDIKDINLIGVTTNPGLLGPLLTGLNAAKTISLLREIPILPANHLKAHLEAIHLTEEIAYPYLGLLVSGGNSIYYLVESKDSFSKLGGTIDDAAGEAFDKGAKLMGLGYPGGKIIDILAKHGDNKKYSFPIALKGSSKIDLSFSGVKTSLRQFLEKNPDYKYTGDINNINPKIINQNLKDLAASYQEAIVQALVLKLNLALNTISINNIPIIVGGGVACNSRLREIISIKFKNTHFVSPSFCTDNGAMIANYALRNHQKAIKWPECLSLDAGVGPT